MKKVLLISFLVLAADQALKFWVKTHMSLGEAIAVTSWFDLHFIENPGMAFGMEFGGGAGKLLLTLFRIVISGLLLLWILNLTRRKAPGILIVPLTLIFAGAVGNIIDSMFYGLLFDDPTTGIATFLPEGGGYAPLLHGKVVDMFYFHFWEGNLPAWLPVWGGKPFVFFPAVFNIADAAVSVGIVSLILFPGKSLRPKRRLSEIRAVRKQFLNRDTSPQKHIPTTMRHLFSIALLLFAGNSLTAQTTSQAYRDYIEKYKDIAIRQMQTERIPASIIMAQGLLESAAGKSYLAVNANNHFGIKCTSDWTGKTIRKDDDRRNECFRKYDRAEESFRDHSAFLKRERYASLYTLDPTDYQAWAKGLKTAGYATDPLYAEKLIRIIENYSLHQLDTQGAAGIVPTTQTVAGTPESAPASGDRYAMYRHANKGMLYVVAFPDDTPWSIAQRFKVPLKKILAYNELRYDSQLIPGQNVFLVKKKTSGADDFYTVSPGDTMYLIAQKTGMTVQSLYTKNRIKAGAMPPEGTRLYLRRTIPRRLAVNDYNI